MIAVAASSQNVASVSLWASAVWDVEDVVTRPRGWGRRAVIVLFCLFVSAAAAGADPVEALAVKPDSVALDRYDGAAVRVNVIGQLAPGAVLPADAEMTVTVPPGVSVVLLSPPDGPGDPVWRFAIRALPDAPDTAAADFRLSYRTDSDGAEAVAVKRRPLTLSVHPSRTAPLAEAVTLSLVARDTPLTAAAPLRAFVVAQNLTESAVTLDRIEVTGPEFLSVSPIAAGDILAPKAVRQYPLTVAVPEARAALAGTWLLHAELSYARGTGDTRQEAVAVHNQAVTVAAAAPAVDGITFELTLGTAPVYEDAPVDGIAILRNTGETPVTLEELTLGGPPFLSVLRGGTLPAVIDPKATVRLPFTVGIADGRKPRIGAWTIVADAQLARTLGGHTERGGLTATAEIQATVPGVSDVLKILELPTILLLPGVLVLATWASLAGARASGKSWLQWKSVSFWIASVFLSILIFFAYQHWADVNFTVAYGLADVAKLWIGCILGASIAYGLLRLGLWLNEVYWRRKLEPRKADTPLDILRKLDRFSMPFYLPVVERSFAGQSQTLFELPFAEKNKQKWVVPKMRLAPKQESEAAETALQEIAYLNNDDRGLGQIIELCEKNRHLVVLDWASGRITSPIQLPSDEIGQATAIRSPISLAD